MNLDGFFIKCGCEIDKEENGGKQYMFNVAILFG